MFDDEGGDGLDESGSSAIGKVKNHRRIDTINTRISISSQTKCISVIAIFINITRLLRERITPIAIKKWDESIVRMMNISYVSGLNNIIALQ